MLSLAFATPAAAGLGDELKRWKDDVGDVLEEARDDVRDEARRTIRRAEELARKARDEAKRLEARIRKLRDEAKGELEKIGVLGKAINEVIDATELAIEASGEVISKNLDMIEVIETAVVERKLDPYEIVIESSSSVLGQKLANAISADKINAFLDKEILGDIKVIDVLLPIQSGLERIDPTGMQVCIREGVVARGASDGKMMLAGAPDTAFASLADAAGLQLAAADVVTGCLDRHVTRRPQAGEGAADEAEIARAKADRDAAVAELKQNEESSQEAEVYYAEMKQRYARYSRILDETKGLAEEARAAQAANEAVARKLAAKLKEAGLDPETYAEILQ